MKRHKLWDFLSHSIIILGAMFVVFFLIDRVNAPMDFLGSEISEWLLAAFAFASIAQGIISASYIFQKRKAALVRKNQATNLVKEYSGMNR